MPSACIFNRFLVGIPLSGSASDVSQPAKKIRIAPNTDADAVARPDARSHDAAALAGPDGRADHDAIDRPLLALLNGGEGFHTPHHDDPHLEQHGPWYADSTYLLIALLERAGLVWGVQRRPRAKAKES